MLELGRDDTRTERKCVGCSRPLKVCNKDLCQKKREAKEARKVNEQNLPNKRRKTNKNESKTVRRCRYCRNELSECNVNPCEEKLASKKQKHLEKQSKNERILQQDWAPTGHTKQRSNLQKVDFPKHVKSGPNCVPESATRSRLTLFLLFWSTVIDHIIIRSAKRAVCRELKARFRRRQFLPSTKNPKNQHNKKWGWSKSSFYLFASVLICVGLIHQPAVNDYWKTTHPLYGSPLIRNTLGRYQFQQMKRSLTFDLDLVMQELNLHFRRYWVPHEDVVVDESLVPTKTRCPYTVIIKRKPKPKGVKLWTLADYLGFLYSFSLFKKISETTCNTLTRMTSFLPFKGHNVRADSYFGSPEAAAELIKQKQNFTLNCRKDRSTSLFASFLHVLCDKVGYNKSQRVYHTTDTPANVNKGVDLIDNGNAKEEDPEITLPKRGTEEYYDVVEEEVKKEERILECMIENDRMLEDDLEDPEITLPKKLNEEYYDVVEEEVEKEEKILECMIENEREYSATEDTECEKDWMEIKSKDNENLELLVFYDS